MSRIQSPGPGGASTTREDNTPLPLGQPSAPNRGIIRSVTNPEFIPGTSKKNPFFETMPSPEIWHRRMPSILPFGETTFMERKMSRQISEDLARGKTCIPLKYDYMLIRTKVMKKQKRPLDRAWELNSATLPAYSTIPSESLLVAPKLHHQDQIILRGSCRM